MQQPDWVPRVFACSPARCWAPWSRLPAAHRRLRPRSKPTSATARRPPPPTLAFPATTSLATDAVILSVQVAGVLLVVRSGETPKEAFTRTRDLLVSVKCNILGVVLNAVTSRSTDYYYSYRYYPYSYGYGPQEAMN